MQPHIPLCVYQIKCSERDMHSGVIGGSVHEAMLTLAITLTLTPTLTLTLTLTLTPTLTLTLTRCTRR